MASQKLSVQCSCDSPEHTFMFIMDDDPEWNDTYLFVHLKPLPFWRRVAAAIRYVFGYTSKYGCFDESVLNDEQLDSILNFVNRVRDAKNKARCPGIPKEEWLGESGDQLQSKLPTPQGLPKLSLVEVRHDREPDGGEDSPAVPGTDPG